MAFEITFAFRSVGYSRPPMRAVLSLVVSFVFRSSKHMPDTKGLLSTESSGSKLPKKKKNESKMNVVVYSQRFVFPERNSIMIVHECVFFCFALIACFISRTCRFVSFFFLLGVGLCLCFKLKQLETGELWTNCDSTHLSTGELFRYHLFPHFMVHIEGILDPAPPPVC